MMTPQSPMLSDGQAQSPAGSRLTSHSRLNQINVAGRNVITVSARHGTAHSRRAILTFRNRNLVVERGLKAGDPRDVEGSLGARSIGIIWGCASEREKWTRMIQAAVRP